MKRNVFLILFAFAAMSFIGCGTEDQKATLSFTNSGSSDGKINTIVWADHNQTWDRDSGYDRNTTTEQKEVTDLTGDVSALVYDGSDYYEANILIENVPDQDHVTLADGSTRNLTLTATAALSGAPKKN